MGQNTSKTTGPIHDLFSNISKIVEFIEIKDSLAARANETSKSAADAELFMNAKLENDDYTTYHKYWTIWMFQEVVPNVKIINVNRWIKNPLTVPNIYRENLRIKGREAFLDQYEETNDYYRMLNGLPPVGTKEEDFIYLTVPMRNQLHASSDPVHKLSPIIQNSYMNTDEYREVLEKNPEKAYLRYMGMYKIDTYIARNAKDFDIIRYPLNRSDINPNLVTEFSKLYSSYRDYIMSVLYNPKLQDLYVNYRNFMGLLIMSATLMQINNKAVEMHHSKNYLDDSVIHEILSMYRIPNSLLLTNETRRKLVTGIYRLVRNKGTDDIYDDIIDILKYDDVKVNKLMLMKGQQFDKNSRYSATDENKPYFLQVDINDSDPYDTIASGKAKIFNYNDITDSDPTWWDDEDTQRVLTEYAYTVSESKYITLEVGIPQMKYLMESIYFSRLILDNKAFTDDFLIEVPELFGSEAVSLYDLMVFIISAMCMNDDLNGDIIIDDPLDRPTATAGFNFDINWDLFEEYVSNSEVVDKDRVLSFMENLTITNSADVTRLYNDVINPMRSWLEYKIAYADDRQEYLEYEAIYRSLYTYDITRNQFLNDYRSPIENIRNNYNITEEEMLMYQHFYPRTFRGESLKVDEYVASRYYPFINRLDQPSWYVHIVLDTDRGLEDRGYLYFHDILNSQDCREIVNPNGTRIFMDYEDEEIGWQINSKAVDKALELIDELDENDLKNAYFVIDTPVLNSDGKIFNKDTKLPLNIRGGLYKQILRDKLLMDVKGLSNPPTTYREHLYRKNEKLYDLLTKNDRFHRNKDAWLNDVMTIVLAVETELNIHLKYFEQSVAGTDSFFKPLITLINRFKSTFVRIAKTSLSYTFDDKIDAGGNSNMLKLFDEIKLVIHFITMSKGGYETQFGLYDVIPNTTRSILINDYATMIKDPITNRTSDIGSLRLSDEVKFFKNGKNIDPSGHSPYWRSGDYSTGRWSEEDDILMKTRDSTERINPGYVDTEGWKEFRQ